jgi:hypothetical protein
MKLVIILILLTIILCLISNNEYFKILPGSVHKVIVERELSRWKLLPQQGNLENKCLMESSSKQIFQKPYVPMHEWLAYARQHKFDVCLFTHEPTKYKKDKDTFVYNQLYSQAYLGKRRECIASLFSTKPFKGEDFNYVYVLDPEKN